MRRAGSSAIAAASTLANATRRYSAGRRRNRSRAGRARRARRRASAQISAPRRPRKGMLQIGEIGADRADRPAVEAGDRRAEGGGARERSPPGSRSRQSASAGIAQGSTSCGARGAQICSVSRIFAISASTLVRRRPSRRRDGRECNRPSRSCRAGSACSGQSGVGEARRAAAGVGGDEVAIGLVEDERDAALRAELAKARIVAGG